MIAKANTEPVRMRQLQRVLLLIELLAPLRYGATAAELAQDISADLGQYCERTIRRDLEALQAIGLVERTRLADKPLGQRTADRWRWISNSMRAMIYRHVAEAQNDC